MPIIRLNDPDPAVLDGRHIRASAFELAQRELIETLPGAPVEEHERPLRALTIGAGYARLPQLLADVGYSVTALDPSPEATAAGRQRPDIDSCGVDHRVSDSGALDEPDDSYDLVWCIDTLEMTRFPGRPLAEISRVTRPGGTVVLDTLNNTLVSRAIYLGLFQRFSLTRVMPAGRYRRDRLLTPVALADACDAADMSVSTIIGYEPASPLALLRALLARRRGQITDGELATRAQFRLSTPGHTPPVTYYAMATPTRHDR